MLGSLSEVHGLIPWMDCPSDLKRRWWPATSQGPMEGVWGYIGETQLAGQHSGAVRVGAGGDTGRGGDRGTGTEGHKVTQGLQSGF